MMAVKIVKIAVSDLAGDAAQIHRALLARGVKVWGVVCSPDKTELYFYEDEEDSSKIVNLINEIKLEMKKASENTTIVEEEKA